MASAPLPGLGLAWDFPRGARRLESNGTGLAPLRGHGASGATPSPRSGPTPRQQSPRWLARLVMGRSACPAWRGPRWGPRRGRDPERSTSRALYGTAARRSAPPHVQQSVASRRESPDVRPPRPVQGTHCGRHCPGQAAAAHWVAVREASPRRCATPTPLSLSSPPPRRVWRAAHATGRGAAEHREDREDRDKGRELARLRAGPDVGPGRDHGARTVGPRPASTA